MSPAYLNDLKHWDWLFLPPPSLTDTDLTAHPGFRKQLPTLQVVPLLQWAEGQLLEAGTRPDLGRQLDNLGRLGDVSDGWSFDNRSEPAALRAALRRLLVRLLRSGRLGKPNRALVSDRLRGSLREEFDPLGRNVWSPPQTELERLLRREDDWRVGRHRLLFPVVTPMPAGQDPHGPFAAREAALVAAEVSVLAPPEGELGRLPGPFLLAPWTCFEMVDGPAEGSQVAAITGTIRAALQRTGLLEEKSGACSLDGRPILFLVDLQPLSWRRDFARPEGRSERILAQQAWWFSPFGFQVAGSSLGLALSLTAWAASTGLAVHPLIATGRVTPGAAVRNVGGEGPKTRVMQAFLDASGKDWLVVLPDSWRGRISCDHWEPVFVNRLQPAGSTVEDFAFNRKLLTDGFDEYRTALGLQGGRPRPELTTPLARMHQALAEAPARRSALQAGYVEEDRTAAEALSRALADWLRLAGQGAAPSPPTAAPLVAPFGEDPQVLAAWLLQELGPAWARTPVAERLGTLPVVVPVPLLGMAERDEPDGRPLEDRLAAAVRARFATATPTAEQFLLALRKPGKLVLLVYAPRSLSWWGLLTGHAPTRLPRTVPASPEPWAEVRRQLRSLIHPPAGRYARQVVIPVCSDAHDAEDWLGPP